MFHIDIMVGDLIPQMFGILQIFTFSFSLKNYKICSAHLRLNKIEDPQTSLIYLERRINRYLLIKYNWYDALDFEL